MLYLPKAFFTGIIIATVYICGYNYLSDNLTNYVEVPYTWSNILAFLTMSMVIGLTARMLSK